MILKFEFPFSETVFWIFGMGYIFCGLKFFKIWSFKIYFQKFAWLFAESFFSFFILNLFKLYSITALSLNEIYLKISEDFLIIRGKVPMFEPIVRSMKRNRFKKSTELIIFYTKTIAAFYSFMMYECALFGSLRTFFWSLA